VIEVVQLDLSSEIKGKSMDGYFAPFSKVQKKALDKRKIN